jgi:SAM-dependent methyltransferase
MLGVDIPDFLAATQDGYDRTAAMYAERFHQHLDDKPVDQAVLSAFAGLISKGRNTSVIDVGCGTGATTASLDGCGLNVSGVDVSANMVTHARRLNPGLSFTVGSMTSLDAADGSVGGICAWYSIIHIPDEHLAGVFGEFHRVLVPGGWVLLAFQVGDEPRVLNHAFGQEVNLTFIRRQPRSIANQLAENGFDVYTEAVRQPDDDGFEATPHAYLIARRTL